MNNNEWKWVYVSLIAAVLFIILMFVASGTMDGMSGGYAVMFISFFLTLSSFAVALLFFTRARAMDDILRGKNLLAHWVYQAEETRKSAEREFVNYKESNRALLYVVGGFILIAMLLMVIFGEEAGVTTAGILFIVLIIIAIVSVVAPRLELKRALNASREAYITDTGIIYEGAVYPFQSFLMKMDGVRFMKGTPRKPPIIGFSFMQLVGLFILRPFEISVPVPAGEEKTAQEIVRKLGGSAIGEEVAKPGSGSCPSCGVPMGPDEGFCELCESKSSLNSHETLKLLLHCPSCGVSLQPGTKFCRSCGEKIS